MKSATLENRAASTRALISMRPSIGFPAAVCRITRPTPFPRSIWYGLVPRIP